MTTSSPLTQPSAGQGRWWRLVFATCFFAYTLFVWQSYGETEFFPHADMTASFMIARDCVEGRGCIMEILPDGGISILGFAAGAIANHLASLAYAVTGDFHGVATLTQVLFALAAAVTFLAAAQHAGLLAGVVAYVVFMNLPTVVELTRTHAYIVLYNFMPIFSACAVLFGLRRTRGGGICFLLLTALCVSLAAQTHQTGFALLPSMLVLAWMGTPGGWSRLRRVAMTVVVFLAAFAMGSYAVLLHLSPRMVLEAVGALHAEHMWLFPLLALGGVTGLVLLSLQRAGTLTRWEDLIYLLCAVLPALPILVVPTINKRYLVPFPPAAAVLCGALFGLAVHRLAAWAKRAKGTRLLGEIVTAEEFPLVLLPAVVVLVPWNSVVSPWRSPPARVEQSVASGQSAERSSRSLGIYDLEPAIKELTSALGGTYENAFARVRVPVGIQAEVLGTMGIFWPLNERADSPSSFHAAVLPSPAGFSLPSRHRGWTFLTTKARYDVALQLFEPYVDPAVVGWQALRLRSEASTPWRRVEYVPPNADLLGKSHRWRLMPEVYEFAYSRHLPPGSDRLLTRFALRVPENGAPRVLLLPPNASGEFSYAIERIEGVPFRGNLPGPIAVVQSRGRAEDGFVEVSTTRRRPPRLWETPGFSGLPPPIFEIEPDVYPLVEPVFAIFDEGHHLHPENPEPFPSLPGAVEEVRVKEVTSLTGASDGETGLQEFFTPDGMHRDSHKPWDIAAPFPFVALVMSVFGVLLAGGIVYCAQKR